MPKNIYKNCFDEAIYKAINCTSNTINIASPTKIKVNETTSNSKLIVPKLNKSYIDRLEYQSRCKEVDLKHFD